MSSSKYALVDGSSYIFRAFFAIAHLSNNAGFPTNALFGFSKMILRLLESFPDSNVVMFFDAGRKTFRNDLYEEYKANRDECPEDLAPQMPFFPEISKALGLPVLMQEGYEADDLIGTVTAFLREDPEAEVTIISGDKDLTQLVDERVKLFDTMRDRWFDPQGVFEKFGVHPHQMVDYLALCGDSSDNIPGLAGCGPKTAAALLQEYSTLENLFTSLESLRENKKIRTRKKLAEQIESDPEIVRLSKKLATILRDAPVQLDYQGEQYILSDLDVPKFQDLLAGGSADTEQLEALFKKFDFLSLLHDFEAVLGASAGEDALSGYSYETVYKSGWPDLVELLKASSVFAFDVETNSLDPKEATLCGISFCCSDDSASYVPLVSHPDAEDSQLVSLDQLRSELQPIFADPKIGKVGQNLKFDIEVLLQQGFTFAGVGFDSMLASYLLEPDASSHSLDVLASRYLRHRMIAFGDVVEKGADFSSVPVGVATEYAAEDAAAAWQLYLIFKELLEESELSSVATDIEFPLVSVLAHVELRGLTLDTAMLAEFSEEMLSEIDSLKEQIFGIAGEEFNLNSPKQLAVILFERLGISTRGVKKTKTGFSTDSSVLEMLAEEHDLPRLLLRYRALHKLRSTYVEALPAQVSDVTSKLHTRLNQSVTATGRLSSSEPNLQNIPIQTPEGRRVREAFIAPEGKVLISADYSQVELRVLAHLSGDEGLIRAFTEDEDIHAATARELLQLGPGDTLRPEERRIGKTINFGIIYGMSAFRLSRDMGIPVATAKKYIDDYFDRYPRVREYFDSLERQGEEQGFVQTLMGRKRFLSAIQSQGRDRGFVMRAALNAPIQGSAADIIKLAMIHLFQAELTGELKARMLLQIHDELLFEVDESESESSTAMIRELMQSVVDLRVPLKVDVRAGSNWGEAH